MARSRTVKLPQTPEEAEELLLSADSEQFFAALSRIASTPAWVETLLTKLRSTETDLAPQLAELIPDHLKKFLAPDRDRILDALSVCLAKANGARVGRYAWVLATLPQPYNLKALPALARVFAMHGNSPSNRFGREIAFAVSSLFATTLEKGRRVKSLARQLRMAGVPADGQHPLLAYQETLWSKGPEDRDKWHACLAYLQAEAIAPRSEALSNAPQPKPKAPRL